MFQLEYGGRTKERSWFEDNQAGKNSNLGEGESFCCIDAFTWLSKARTY